MLPPSEKRSLALTPYNSAEALTTQQAAGVALVSSNTILKWCEVHGIGRRLAGGRMKVSKVALAMLLDDDMIALAQYLAGDRTSPIIVAYFARFGMKPTVCAQSAQ